jgi:hypothetical protein
MTWTSPSGSNTASVLPRKRRARSGPSLERLLAKYSTPLIREAAEAISRHTSPFVLRQTQPNLPPERAWLLGALLVAGRELPRSLLDSDTIHLAAKTLLAISQEDYCESLLEKLRLPPVFVDAYQLWQNPGSRFEVQLRVLAEEPEKTIAARFGTPPAVIMAAERMFFDVRSRLEVPSYVINSAIRLYDESSSHAEAKRKVQLLMAYHSGSACVDLMLYGTLSPRDQKPASGAELSRRFMEDTRNSLQLKGTIATHLLDLADPKTTRMLFKQVTQEPRGKKMTPKQLAEEEIQNKRLEDGLAVFLKSPPWRQYSADSGASATT